MHAQNPRVLFLGQVEYAKSYAWMQAFNASRDADMPDEIWLLNHPPVYTQGSSCDAIPEVQASNIPVLKTDRGGQITYHGPGQLVVYLLLDIKRLGFGPKTLVRRIEAAIIDFLLSYGVHGEPSAGAPGVYVAGQKIAALGLRIKNGCCYHGLSLNVDMDLKPFEDIDPCGYKGLKVTQLSAFAVEVIMLDVSNQLVDCLIASIYSATD
jgi:lipoyl(octanoyl) transferase